MFSDYNAKPNTCIENRKVENIEINWFYIFYNMINKSLYKSLTAGTKCNLCVKEVVAAHAFSYHHWLDVRRLDSDAKVGRM